MRFNRFAAATAAVALTLGTTAVLPAVAGAQDTTTTTVGPVGPDVTQVRSMSLACTSIPDFSEITGPLNLSVNATTVLPEYAIDGETVSFASEFTLSMPQGLLDLAGDAGITELPVSNFSMNATTSGGIEGGPYSATPTSFSIPVATGMATVSMAGDFTVTDQTTPGVIMVVNPVTYSMNISLGQDVIALDVTCDISPVQFASINGELPPEPPTTPTTAAPTTAEEGAVETSPRFTG